MTEVRNIRLLLEYEGTGFAGWQLQDHQPTIQGALQHALERMTRERPTVSVAGRTDAGVHAVGQVANFQIDSSIPTERFATGLNRFLPHTISVHRSDEAPLGFDARHHSSSKRYRYRIYEGPNPSALERRFAWHLSRHLHAERMRDAARLLIGHLDFESFRSTHCDAPHAVRDMLDIRITEAPRPPVGRVVEIEFHANAFCRHMCRILAGTLAEIGWGERSPVDVERILGSRDRVQAGQTAPAMGLTLLQVVYPPDGRLTGHLRGAR